MADPTLSRRTKDTENQCLPGSLDTHCNMRVGRYPVVQTPKGGAHGAALGALPSLPGTAPISFSFLKVSVAWRAGLWSDLTK